MSTQQISRRYAQALFELAQEGVDLANGLEALAAVAAEAEVRELLDSPQFPAELKINVLKKGAGVGTGPELDRLLALLVERNKAALLPEIYQEYVEKVRAAAEAVAATVTVATPLSGDATKRVASALAAATGKKVTLDVVEDASIIGGMVIKIGDRQIDCSLRGRLDGLRRAMAA